MAKRFILVLLALSTLLLGSTVADAIPAGRLRFAVSTTPPPAGLIVPGVTTFGSWAPTVYTTPEGSPSDFGYSQRAIGGWTTPMYEVAEGSTTYTACVTAYKAPTYTDYAAGHEKGIKEVRFSLNDGPWLTVSSPAPHPIYGNLCYPARINASASALSGPGELRAIVVPYSGQPFVLQGFPNVKVVPPNGDYPRMNAIADDMWSMVVNLDPNGATLPSTDVYLSPTGSDGANCLTAGTPCATWDRAMSVISTAQGGDVGGGVVNLLAGSYSSFGSTRTAANPLYVAANQYVTATHAPGVPKASVVITSSTSNGLYVEKGAFRSITGQGSGRGLVGDAVFKNFNSSGTVSLNYMSTLFQDVTYDGGPSFNQPGVPPGCGGTPLPPCTTPIDSTWAGPGFSNIGNGHNAFINIDLTRTRGSGWFTATLILNSGADRMGSSSDIQNNTKVVSNLTISNVVENISGGVHVDGYQWVHSDTSSGVVRTMYIIENYTAKMSYQAQGIFGDATTPLKDIAVFNADINTNGINSPGFCIGTVSQNAYTLSPNVVGNVCRYDSDTPTGTSVGGGPAVVSNGIRFALSASKSFLTNLPLWGFSTLFPSTTADPGDPQPTPSFFESVVPGSSLYVVYDAGLMGRLQLRDNLNGTFAVPGIITNVDYGTIWTPGTTSAGAYTTNSVLVEATARSQAPIYNPAGINGHPTLTFNGIQSITGTKGSALTSGNSGYPLALRAVSQGGAGLGELWMGLVINDPTTPTTGGTQDRVYWAAGGTATNNSIDIRRRVAVANQNALYCGVGVTNGTPTRVAAVTPPGTSFTGATVVRCQMLSDRVRITAWNVANPAGVTSDTLYGVGYVQNVTGARTNVGSDTSQAVGVVGQFPAMEWGGTYGSPPLTGTDETNAIAIMKLYFLGI